MWCWLCDTMEKDTYNGLLHNLFLFIAFPNLNSQFSRKSSMNPHTIFRSTDYQQRASTLRTPKTRATVNSLSLTCPESKLTRQKCRQQLLSGEESILDRVILLFLSPTITLSACWLVLQNELRFVNDGC